MGASVVSMIAGIVGSVKALKPKSANGNGHVDRKEWHDLKDKVGDLRLAQALTDQKVNWIVSTVETHGEKLDNIRDVLADIKAAVKEND